MKQFYALQTIANCSLRSANLNSRQFKFFNSNQYQIKSICGLNRYTFCSNQAVKNDQENNTPQQQQNTQEYTKPKSFYQTELEKRYSKEKIEQVQNELKNQKVNLYDYLLQVNNQTRDNYLYSNDVLLNNVIHYKYLKDDPKQIMFLGAFWSGIGYLSTFAHPYLSVFPAMFAFGGLFSYLGGRTLVRKTIEKIEFVPNEIEKVKIYLLKREEPIICRIDHLEVIDVNENIDHPYVSDKIFKNSQQFINIQKDISVTINAQDLNGDIHNALNLVIFGNKDLTQISNYNLLTTVLEGDVIRLNKFKVAKKETVSDNFIENMLADNNAQKVIAQQKQQEQLINDIDQQIQQEIQRFSKKKN